MCECFDLLWVFLCAMFYLFPIYFPDLLLSPDRLAELIYELEFVFIYIPQCCNSIGYGQLSLIHV